MDKNAQLLEKNIVYRLLKVVYILTFLFVCLVVGVLGWNEKPTQYTDNKKSYLACENGLSYTLESAKVYVWTNDNNLDSHEDKDARKVCAFGITDDYLGKYQNPPNKNYTLNLVHSTRGSWQSVLLWWFLGISVCYIVLNLVFETLLYILFGKKFTWEWVTKIGVFLNNK